MADTENNDELSREVKFWFDKANQELARFGMVTSSTAAKLKKAVGANTAALDKNTDQEAKLAKAKKNRAASIAKTASQMAGAANKIRGNRDSFESLNPAIRMTGAALGKAGKMIGDGTNALGEAVSGIGALGGKFSKTISIAGSAMSILGKGLSGASGAAAELATQFGEFATGELQNVMESFRQIGSVGAISVKGVTGLYDQAVNAGMTIKAFSGLVNQNGQALALAFGNTADGAEALAKMGKESLYYRDSMIALGMTVADQRKYQAGFIAQNQLIGMADMKDSKAMAKASGEYLEQLDLMSRITGKSKDELAKKLESDLQNVRIQATLAAVQEKYGKEGVDNMRLQWEMIEKEFGPEIASGFKENFFNAGSAKAQEFAAQMGGSQSDLAQAMAGAKTDEERVALLNEFRNRLYASSKRIATSAVGMGTSLDITKKAEMRSKGSVKENAESIKAARAAQQAAMNTQDQNTKNLVEANAAVNDMAVDADRLVKDKVLPVAAQSIKTFTTTLNEAVDAMTEALGLSAPKSRVGPMGGSYDVSDAMSGAVGNGTGSYGGGGGAPGASTAGESPAAPPAGGTQAMMDSIKQQESGGNYQAQNKNSTASGAYQFIDSTWQSLTKQHGIGQEFARAKDAPKEIQDLIAQKHVEGLLKKAGGDMSKVPVGWLTGNVQGKMDARGVAINQSIGKYQGDIMSRYNQSIAAMGAGAGAAIAAGRPGSPSANLAHQQEMARLDAQEAAANKQIAEANKARGANTQIAGLPSGLPMGRPGTPSYNMLAKQMAEEKMAPEYQARIDQAQKRKAELAAKMAQPATEVTAANGGVFSGPKSGYAATLHGDEAVVPMNNQKSLTVDGNPAASGSSDQTLQLMMAQSGKLEQLVRILSQNASTSEKMLRASV